MPQTIKTFTKVPFIYSPYEESNKSKVESELKKLKSVVTLNTIKLKKDKYKAYEVTGLCTVTEKQLQDNIKKLRNSSSLFKKKYKNSVNYNGFLNNMGNLELVDQNVYKLVKRLTEKQKQLEKEEKEKETQRIKQLYAEKRKNLPDVTLYIEEVGDSRGFNFDESVKISSKKLLQTIYSTVEFDDLFESKESGGAELPEQINTLLTNITLPEKDWQPLLGDFIMHLIKSKKHLIETGEESSVGISVTRKGLEEAVVVSDSKAVRGFGGKYDVSAYFEKKLSPKKKGAKK